ncbi:MAG TPA: hypothetical protein VKE69_13790 [Planctomycetota bacterium]|nr:hypothetical protein [Planctomycetota bacterium]
MAPSRLAWTCALAFAACTRDSAPASRPVVVSEDAHVTELMREVEEARGRSFVRPVPVRYLSQEELDKELKATWRPPWIEPEMVALDELLGIDVAPEDSFDGIYVPLTESIVAVNHPDASWRDLTLRHELCHALDDQHFGFLRRARSRRPGSLDAMIVETSIIEASAYELGDPDAFFADMAPERFKALVAEEGRGAAVATRPRAESRPREVVCRFKAWMYDIAWRAGRRLIEDGALRTGESRAAVVDRIFQAPPHCSRELLHPEQYWGARTHAVVDIDLPESESLGAPIERVGNVTLGEAFVCALTAQNRLTTLMSAVAAPTSEQLAQWMRETSRQPWDELPTRAASGWLADRAWILARDERDRALLWCSVWETEAEADEFLAAMKTKEDWSCLSFGNRVVAIADALAPGTVSPFWREVGERAARAFRVVVVEKGG